MIKSVLIVGGGTAGWMTAAYLSKAFGKSINITVIESGKIKKIGVGEATFSTVRHYFDYLGVEEREWLPFCAGSYKLGIRFQNWDGENNHFYHPFERWEVVKGFPLSEWWLKEHKNNEKFDFSTFYTPYLCEAKRSPRNLDGSLYSPEVSDVAMGETTLYEQSEQFPYAYHFDADGVADFLKRYSIDRGVSHIIDEVTAVNKNENDFITNVETKLNGIIDAELFIDCTGFSSIILGTALNEPFCSFSDVLKNDSAVALRVKRNNDEIEPYTTAMTMNAGWRWTIPLFERNGYGYVYSSEYITPEEAETELRNSIPYDNAECEANHIKMRIGRSNRSWVNNCVAIGLASAFVEPLESTGIFFIQHGIEQLVKFFPDRSFSPSLREEYNSRVNHVVDGVKEFLILHFFGAGRNDTAYWKDWKKNKIPTFLKQRLDMVRHSLLDEETIYPYYHGFESYSWNTMIMGLGLGPYAGRPALQHMDSNEALLALDELKKQAERMVDALPGCNEYLKYLHKGIS
uniref:tryptophan halogenase family protein n=1 Tax=Scandinavium goeteborgense TaxID=1851514 RepID=UPI00135C9A8A|nr:tryptophan halogenase family protein [Scandinavium goeteborgense]